MASVFSQDSQVISITESWESCFSTFRVISHQPCAFCYTVMSQIQTHIYILGWYRNFENYMTSLPVAPVTLSLEGSKGRTEDRKREKSHAPFSLLIPASLTPAKLFSLCSGSLFPWLQLMIPVCSISNTQKNRLLLARMPWESTQIRGLKAVSRR